MNNLNSKLFVVAAPSGTGKTTIVNRILDDFENITFSISATTRKPRGSEKNGVEYFFLSEKEFLDKIENNEFIEWEKFYDYYYGTLKSFVESKLDKNNSVLMDLDVKGAVNIKKNYPDAVTIFIKPPDLNELKKRLINRGTDSEDDLAKRLDRAEMELAYSDKFDFIVINDELELAVNEVKNIIKNIEENENV